MIYVRNVYKVAKKLVHSTITTSNLFHVGNVDECACFHHNICDEWIYSSKMTVLFNYRNLFHQNRLNVYIIEWNGYFATLCTLLIYIMVIEYTFIHCFNVKWVPGHNIWMKQLLCYSVPFLHRYHGEGAHIHPIKGTWVQQIFCNSIPIYCRYHGERAHINPWFLNKRDLKSQ